MTATRDLPILPPSDAKAHIIGKVKKAKSGKKVNKKQKVWEFMRRNRTFRVGDMMAIFDMKRSYAKWILWFFKKQGLIIQLFSGKRFEDSVYKVVRDIGVKSPNTIIKRR